MRKKKTWRVILSFVVILSMLITSSSLTRATERMQGDIDRYNVDIDDASDTDTDINLTDYQDRSEAQEESSQEEDRQSDNLTYEDNNVVITIQSNGQTIDRDTKLKVTPITSQNPQTQANYSATRRTLNEKMVNAGYKVTGNTVYDIQLVDASGKELISGRDYIITFTYKNNYIPQDATQNVDKTKVRIMQFVENTRGEITQVSDLINAGRVNKLDLTEQKEIKSAEIVASCAQFSIAWIAPIEKEEIKEEATTEAATTEEATTEAEKKENPAEATTEAEKKEDPAEVTTKEKEETTEAEEKTEEQNTTAAEGTTDDTEATEEENKQTFIKITANGVALRSEPTVESEALAELSEDTELPLLDTVEVDEYKWYQVSYEEKTGYVRSDLAEIVEKEAEKEEAKEEESEPEEAKEVSWEQKVGDTTVKVTAKEGSLPENAELVVKAIEDEKEMEQITEAVEEKAAEDEFAIKGIFAYDITFLVDGEEVQPLTPVQVTVETPEIEKDDNANVYHVDEKNNTEEMETKVDEDGNVVFDAPHFSTYVIVNGNNDKAITVKVEHYDSTTNKKIYSDDTVTLDVGKELLNYNKAQNWTVKEVRVTKSYDNTSATYDATNADVPQLTFTGDATVKVYYQKSQGTLTGSPLFFDYLVNSNSRESINQESNYKHRYSIPANKRISVGAHNYNNTYKYYTYTKNHNGGDAAVNEWLGQGVTDPNRAAANLVQGLNADGSVKFNPAYDEPGLFDEGDLTTRDGSKYLRKVYNDYTLQFGRNGDTYTLDNVYKGSSSKYSRNGNQYGANFFPLNDAPTNYSKRNNGNLDNENSIASGTNNQYFGMRYEIEFKLGDYIGPLKYKFTGDDDLWVILDGGKNNQKVIIDLGGIHSAMSKEVDLWEELLLQKGIIQNRTQYSSVSETAKEALRKRFYEHTGADGTRDYANETHKLTVLYMERGAHDSNCYMEYTLPNAQISTPSSVPTANLELTKQDNNNNPLSGAVFSLVDKANAAITYTATSAADGKISFEKLRAGSYTLTEISAPNGYVKSDDTWTVEVTGSGNSLTATAYKNGENGQRTNETVNTITNTPEEDWLKGNMDYDKTAHVENWEERTYKVDITAKAIPVTERRTVDAPPADIVLVLDRSGSMSGNKMTQLKNAAMNFVDGVKEKSPNSRISIVSFASDVTTNRSWTNVSTGAQTLKDTIDKLSAYGATRTDYGLSTAQTVLNSAKYAKKLILFTDGVPTTASDWDDTVATKATNTATILKNNGTTIYTVGLGLTDRAKTWLKGGRYYYYNDYYYIDYTGIATSANHAYETGDASGILTIFNQISQDITRNESISDVTIKDVIDDRFDLVSVDGEKDYTIETDANGRKYVLWNSQTVTKDGWHRTIHLKAKEDYIGGNNITTNYNDKITPNNGTYIEYNNIKVPLPQPVVNVKVDLKVKNNEITIYKGHTIPTNQEILDALLDKKDGNQYLTGEYLKSYAGVKESNLELTWYTDEACTQKISVEDMSKPANETTHYYLKVTYNCGDPTDDSNKNTTLNNKVYIAGNEDRNGDSDKKAEAVNVDDPNKRYGVYTINVYELIKVSKSSHSLKLKDAEFELSDGTTTYYGKSDENGFVVWYTDAAYSTKAVAFNGETTYTLTEKVAPAGYQVSTVTGSLQLAKFGSLESFTGLIQEPDNGNTYLFENEVLYSLPESGGRGIYMYMLAGIFCMLAGAYIMMKKREWKML